MRSLGPHKHPPPHIAVKVAFSLHTAIVLPRVIFELDTNPFAGCKVREANIADDADSAVGELHGLADSEILGRHFW